MHNYYELATRGFPEAIVATDHEMMICIASVYARNEGSIRSPAMFKNAGHRTKTDTGHLLIAAYYQN